MRQLKRLFAEKLSLAIGNAVSSLVQPTALLIKAVRLAGNHAEEPTEIAD